MWRLFLVAILIVATMTVVRPQISMACSCATATIGGAFARADHVFQGRVAEIESWREDPNAPFRALLEIDTVWKGEVVSEVYVQGGGSSSCLVPWQKGRSYIVFARSADGGPLATSWCDGTGMISLSETVTAFGSGILVPDDAPPHSNVSNPGLRPADAQFISWVVATIAVAGGFLALVFIARRRLR